MFCNDLNKARSTRWFGQGVTRHLFKKPTIYFPSLLCSDTNSIRYITHFHIIVLCHFLIDRHKVLGNLLRIKNEFHRTHRIEEPLHSRAYTKRV